MTSLTLHPAKSLQGIITVPGDKSISHRCVICASIAEGESTIKNLLLGEDVLSTIRIFQQLGVEMSHKPAELKSGDILTVYGKGLHSLKASQDILDCGNSGTTMRLMLGLLSGQNFESTLTGDHSLNKRPMERVMKPLHEMGAGFSVKEKGGKRLITVRGTKHLKGIDYTLPVASAQIKSSLLLAGLYASSRVDVTEPAPSRDHTEIILRSLGADFSKSGLSMTLKSGGSLKPFHAEVPGDFSSAAFFMVAGVVIPNSNLVIKGVCINPTRKALFDILKRMGGNISLENEREMSGEPVADIRVRSSRLKGTELKGDEITNVIDEIPIFSVAAASAVGKSEVFDAEELRVKESDRISVLVTELKKLGVDIQEKKDGFIIQGGKPFQSGTFDSHGDHRIAMSCAIAALQADAPSTIQDIACVSTSFPGFFDLLKSVTKLKKT